MQMPSDTYFDKMKEGAKRSLTGGESKFND